jgi:ankyrin repeat protein
VECIAEAYKAKMKSDSTNPLRKALEYAVQMKHMSVVKYLMKEEPNIYKMEKSDKSLLQQAAKATMEIKIGKLEVGNNIGPSDTSLLQQAINAGNLELLRFLVEERQADVNNKYDTNTTALHLASQRGHLEIVKYLIERRSDMNAPDTFSQTPLHLAVKRKNLDIVKFLFEKGADLQARNRNGVNILIQIKM